MKIKLPLLGQVLTGTDAKAEPIVQTIEVPVEKSILQGSFLDFGTQSLSNEKTISSKLIDAYYEWVYINISTLAEEVSKLEPELYQMVMRGGVMEMQPIEDHPILDLLDRFNDSTTRSDGMYLTEAHLDLAGDCFWYLEGGENGGLPTGIYLLQPDKITVNLGDVSAGSRLIESYTYQNSVGGETISQTYQPDEILHIKVPNPKNPYRGFSAVEGIADSLDVDANALNTTKKFYENGMMANFVLSTEKNLSSDQLKKLRAEMRAAYSGSNNAFKVPIFGGGISVQQLSMSSKDAEQIKQQTWMRDVIMAAFKNTKASLGITEDVNRANAEASLANWKRSVILPKMQRIANAINEFIVPRYGDNLILGVCDPVPEDKAAKIAEAKALKDAGIIDRNEAREMVGYEPVEGGDGFAEPVVVNSPDDLPKSVQNVNWKQAMKRAGIREKKMAYKQLLPEARKMAKKIIHKDAAPDIEIHELSHDEKLAYQQKQLSLIDRSEASILNKLEQYFKGFTDRVVHNVETNLPTKNVDKDDLFDEEFELKELADILTPSFVSIAASSSSEALRLIKNTKAYMPSANDPFIKDQVDKFSKSLLHTDREKLTGIISSGVANGNGTDKIARAIRSEFPDFTKNQAKTISRTEVLRTGNHYAIEGWRQSGVVTEKEWLCDSSPCDYCAPLQGTKQPLDDNFFDKGAEWLGDADSPMHLDYDSVEGGNLHPNCECTIVPVISADFGGAGAAINQDDSFVGTLHHGSGGGDFGTTRENSMGTASYWSRSKETAALHGEVTSAKLPIKESDLIKFANEDQYQFVKNKVLKYHLDHPEVSIDDAWPKVVRAMGFKGAETLETFDPQAGIAIYVKSILPDSLKTIENLESQIDKRTKEFKELQKLKLDQDDYIAELEKLAGINE